MVTGVPQREGHMSTCGGGVGGSNPGHFEEARPVTQQKWCIHPTHYPLARKSRRKAGRDIWSHSHLVTHFPSFREASGSPRKKLSTVKIRYMEQRFGAPSLQSRSPGFKSELEHSLTVWLQTSHSSLILSACKMEQYYLPCRIMGNNTPEGCSTLPAMKQKFPAVLLRRWLFLPQNPAGLLSQACPHLMVIAHFSISVFSPVCKIYKWTGLGLLIFTTCS